MKTMRTSIAICAALAVVAVMASSALAQPKDATDHAKIIAAFIDEQTVAVGHADVAKLNTKDAWAKVEQVLKPYEPKPGELLLAKQWAESFLKAGGTDIYGVWTLADWPPIPFVMVPLKDSADANALAILFGAELTDPATKPAATPIATSPPSEMPAQRGGNKPVAARIGGMLVICPSGQLGQIQRLRTAKPADRPEIAQAFAAVSDSPVQVVAAPTLAMRRLANEMMPQLPSELGGGSVAVVTSATWLAIGLNLPPEMRLSAIVQCPDAEKAKALGQWLDAVLTSVAKQRGPARVVPNLDKVLAMLRPTVSASRLDLSLDEKKIDSLIASLVVPIIVDARADARQQYVLSQAMEITKAIAYYEANHKEQFPPNLQALVDGKYLVADALRNPADPKREIGFVYVRPQQSKGGWIKNSDKTIVLYQAFDDWPERGIAVGFANTSGMIIRDRAEFEKLLKSSSSQPATTTTSSQ